MLREAIVVQRFSCPTEPFLHQHSSSFQQWCQAENMEIVGGGHISLQTAACTVPLSKTTSSLLNYHLENTENYSLMRTKRYVYQPFCNCYCYSACVSAVHSVCLFRPVQSPLSPNPNYAPAFYRISTFTLPSLSMKCLTAKGKIRFSFP